MKCTHKSPAIVLRSIKYGESKLIVDTFTRSDGRLSFVTTLSNSGKSKIKKQFFQPTTLLNIEYDYRQKVQLQKFTDVASAYPYQTVTTDPYKLSISLFISEFLYYALRGEQQNEALFDYVSGSMHWLDNSDGPSANFHIVFLLRLSLFLGFYPNLEDYSQGDYFDLRGSCFCSTPPVHRDFLMPEDAAKIRIMMRMNYSTMHLFRMSHTDRNRLVDIIISYYRIHIPDFPELKSLSVLRELFV